MKSIIASAASLVSLLASSALALPQTTTASSATACNNSPSLCSRSYANVTYLGAHDVPFVSNSSNSYTVSGNQFYNATTALSAGVRLLQGQIQTQNSSLHLCHTDCSLYDAGPVEDWLADIKAWMDINPNEVVTILLVNGPNAPVSELGPAFTNSGIDKYGYTPSSSSPSNWPTLQEMISANTRLVTFIASLDSNTGYEYLLSEFSYVWENPFDVTSASNFSCIPQRPSLVANSFSAAQNSGMMFLMNHFLDQQQLFGEVPDVNAAGSTNSPDTSVAGSLGSAASTCTSQYGAKPNFLLVDWFNVGPAITTADNLNGISDVTGRLSVSSNILSQSSSSGASERRGSSLAGLVVGFGVAIAVGLI